MQQTGRATLSITDQRLENLTRWTQDLLDQPVAQLIPISGDASFRRYFRVVTTNQTLVAMDAPPERETSRPFISVSALLRDRGLNVPQVLQADLKRGFLLLTDLGSTSYLSALNRTTAANLYADALNALLVIQTQLPHSHLPVYDRARLMGEMGLFRDWFLEQHCGIVLNSEAQAVLHDTFTRLTDAALAQARVFVHRDFHSRNLMVTPVQNPGILDFQDAVSGPLTYDLVSLFRDCYIAWPADQVTRWAQTHCARLAKNSKLQCDEEQFLHDFDLMGMQRHLKAIGIFARLKHRDGKSAYLSDIPRTFRYVLDVCNRYPSYRSFRDLMDSLGVSARWLK